MFVHRVSPVPRSGRLRRAALLALGPLFAFAVGIGAAQHAEARTIGLAADNTWLRVTVFDADTDTVLGTVSIPTTAAAFGDTEILPDQSLGFVTDAGGRVWVIDLQATPPALAAGVNPIAIGNAGLDLSLSPDGRFLAAVGFLPGPISVIDVAGRTATSFSAGRFTAIDVCADGSVLVAENDATLRRFALDASGVLTDTGEVVAAEQANNVSCAPDGVTAVTITRGFTPQANSFQVVGLAPLAQLALPATDFGVSLAFASAADRVYLRSQSTVSVYEYDPASGSFGALLASTGGLTATSYYGMEQLALHESAGRLYASNATELRILDATSLASLGALPGFHGATGISIREQPAVCGNGALEADEQCDDGNGADGDGCSVQCLLEEPTLTLAPATGESAVGETHALSAHVGFGGSAAAGQDVLFEVSGANPTLGSAASDAAGDAAFSYSGVNPGEDSIHACWDVDGDGLCGADEPSAAATRRWLPAAPTSTPGCSIDYHGEIRSGRYGRAYFWGITAVDRDGEAGGLHFFEDRAQYPSLRAHSLTIERVTCERGHAAIEGEARIHGRKQAVPYRIELADVPGPDNDTYRIQLGSHYDSGIRRLREGDIDVHVRRAR